MIFFYCVLDEIQFKGCLVCIVVFGDFFIEVDIFIVDLCEMLQKCFGGCGVGFVIIILMISGYCLMVCYFFGGWFSYVVIDSVYFDKKK